jgi:hypothetical protein
LNAAQVARLRRNETKRVVNTIKRHGAARGHLRKRGHSGRKG